VELGGHPDHSTQCLLKMFSASHGPLTQSLYFVQTYEQIAASHLRASSPRWGRRELSQPVDDSGQLMSKIPSSCTGRSKRHRGSSEDPTYPPVLPVPRGNQQVPCFVRLLCSPFPIPGTGQTNHRIKAPLFPSSRWAQNTEHTTDPLPLWNSHRHHPVGDLKDI